MPDRRLSNRVHWGEHLPFINEKPALPAQIDPSGRGVRAVSPTDLGDEAQPVRLSLECKAVGSICEISNRQSALYLFPKYSENGLSPFECLGSVVALLPNGQRHAKARVGHREQSRQDGQ
jgi:hypothetical protein